MSTMSTMSTMSAMSSLSSPHTAPPNPMPTKTSKGRRGTRGAIASSDASSASGMGTADLTITDAESAEFAVKVSDETTTVFSQDATITEEGSNDVGTFQFSLSGVTLVGSATADVVVTVSGDTENDVSGGDFTADVIDAI